MVAPVEILKRYWGYDAFRPLQEDIVNAVLSGKDTLGLLPTGGGKSICFQVPAMMLDGVCIVITPLIALMKDQVANLEARGIAACALHTGMGWRELELELENSLHGKYRFLYVSPERLQSGKFQAYARNMNISLIAVDEAHCISQWGYDFRPEYLRIAEFRQLFVDIPVIALTASATPPVVADIQEKLRFKQRHVFASGFSRPNLSYVVQHEENKREKIADVCRKLKGTGIVYMRNRKGTKDMAAFLTSKGISTDYYHAGLSNAERSLKQEKWKNNTIRVMVCTNAFGMGIDKPDVRFVIHEQKPESLEAYYQEAGRAGRDGKRSYCLLLDHPGDHLDDERQLQLRFPSPETVNRIYQAVCNYLHIAVGSGEGTSYDFDPVDFAAHYKMELLLVHHTLGFLSGQNYLQVNEAVYTPSKIRITEDYAVLYDMQLKDKTLDTVFKTLTRSYGGIFDHYTVIHEKELAKRLRMPEKELKQLLMKYHRMGLIDYQERKEKPQLVMTENRYPEIRVNAADMAFLKARYLERQQSVNAYIVNKTTCRQVQLVKYFGEEHAADCGICDICLQKKNPSDISKGRFSAYCELLKEEVSKQPVTLQQLPDRIAAGDNAELIKVVRWLMDQQILTADSKGTLYWNEAHA